MKTTNPFPGMNPLLEPFWPDVHTTLIGYIRDALSTQLPPDLVARSEEAVRLEAPDRDPGFRADVAVSRRKPVALQLPQQSSSAAEGSAVMLAEPEIVFAPAPTPRWIEVREVTGRIITLIEVLGPTNKSEPGRSEYLQKQSELTRSRINLVEIDLLLSGTPCLEDKFLSRLRPSDETRFLVVVTRAEMFDRREVYYYPLRKRLPTVGVPLRSTDRDIALDLQQLVDRCYDTGRYWLEPIGPLPLPLSPSESQWVATIVAGAASAL